MPVVSPGDRAVMTDITAVARPKSGYLMGAGFDHVFIFGLPVFALASALVVIQAPQLFPLVLMMDMWLIGYHHVIATYTRLCFDRESVRQHRFLLFWLPPIVLTVTLAAGLGIGLWVIGTVYLYWQWFHYARQSWGIAQIYRRKAGQRIGEPEWFSQFVFYLVPVWGILERSAQQPATFIGLEIRTLPVPPMLADAVGVVACIALIAWVALRARMWVRGELPLVHTLYLVTHFIIFAAAYLVIEDITYGWLAINIWHNLQYLLFVWLFNNQKFRGGIDPKARLLSHLSQTRNIVRYFAFTLAITIAAYAGIRTLVIDVLAVSIPIILMYQTVNFHHYIVDAVIWKARKKPIQTALSLPPI